MTFSNSIKMKRSISILVFVCLIVPSFAQTMGAYVNYRNKFMVFEDGIFRSAEYQVPKAFKIGGNYVAYLDNADNLKIFRNGRSVKLEGTRSIDPTVTNYFMGYTVAGVLKVYDDEKLKTLCYNTGEHVVQDSIVAWSDRVNQTLSVYEYGKTTVIEDGIAGEPINNFKAGDNILAYVTNVERKFKVYYDGDVWDVNDYVDPNMRYGVGRDLVAYEDVSSRTFNAFYQGNVYDIEDFMPKKFVVGDGIMAYIDIAENLKVFEGGKIYTAADFAPDNFLVQDSLVIWQQQGFLWCFNNGQTYQVSRYIPRQWKASWSTLAFIDQNNNISMFKDGQVSVLARENIREFDLNRNVIVYKTGVNTNKVWYKGKVYEGD